MNNNYQLHQNVFNSGIHYPTQISQNLNYFIYLTIDNPSMQNLNANPIFSNSGFENTVNKQDNPPTSNDASMIFNYNPFMYFNYAAMNEFFNNHNNYLSTLPQNVFPQNHDISLLNSKRKRDMKDTEENSVVNMNVCEKKNDIIINNNISNKNGVLKDDEKIEKTKETDEFYQLGKDEKSVESENKETNEKESIEDQKEKNEKNKKCRNKKKKMCQELLQDSLLEHIGETKPKMMITDEELSVIVGNSNAKKKSQNIHYNQDKKKEKEKDNSPQQSDNNIIQYKKINKTKANNINIQSTKVIYHGNKYEKTENINDFMKYNFNFCVEEQYKSKKLIIDYENQHVNLEKLNNGFFQNNNSNETTKVNIEAKWLRSKFQGDDHQLKKAINLIQDILKSNRNTVEQEKCLDIIRINDYNMGEISKFKCM